MPGRYGDTSDHGERVVLRVLEPTGGDTLGAVNAVRDRFLIDGQVLGAGFSLLEQRKSEVSASCMGTRGQLTASSIHRATKENGIAKRCWKWIAS